MSEPAPTRESFARLSEAQRRGLRRHCYRMLGGLHDAEDAVQETLLRAWRGFDGFGGGSFRGWLCRIATNVCLDQIERRGAARRWLPDGLDPEARSGPGAAADVDWIEPYPDEPADEAPGPEARYAEREAVRLAFVAALQELPPRQRAALLLCDVLGWSSAEAGATLGSSVAAVNSALQRARETLGRLQGRATAAAPRGEAEARMLERYLNAWENHDIDALVAALREDAVCVMPPWRLWLPDRAAIVRFFVGAWASCPGLRLVACAANGQPGFAVYQRAPDGSFAANALHVLTPGSEALAGVTLFLDPEGRLFEAFGLPKSLPA